MVVTQEFQEVLDVSAKSVDLSLPHIKESNLKVEFGLREDCKTQFSGSEPPLPFAVSEVFHTSIISWRRLTAIDQDCKAVYEVTFDVKGSNFQFKPGDTIGILPHNDKDEVDFLINCLNFTSEADLQYTLTSGNEQKCSKSKTPGHIPIKSTLRHVLTHCLDIRAVVKKLFLLALSRYTQKESERRALEYLCSKEGSAAYTNNILNTNTCLLDLLTNFKSCKPPIEVLFQHLPRLLPRPYSIANSPLLDPDVLKICFSVINIGKNRKGLTTGWIENIILKQELSLEDSFKNLSVENSHQIPIYLRKNVNCFGLPEKLNTSLILIGPGTGVAPYIGFLEEIECLRQQGVEDEPCVWLFFGCRHPKLDFIYEAELNNFLDKNVLSCLKTSFSRYYYDDYKTKYVQDAILENAEDIVKLIQDGSIIYVCGDAKTMAVQIKDAIVACLVRCGRTKEDAEKFVCEMQISKKYIVDIWS